MVSAPPILVARGWRFGCWSRGRGRRPYRIGDDDDENKRYGGDLSGQGQTQSDPQRYAASPPGTPGYIRGQIQGEHNKEGEQRVGGIKVGKLNVKDGQG